jgi:hypothetical protein
VSQKDVQWVLLFDVRTYHAVPTQFCSPVQIPAVDLLLQCRYSHVFPIKMLEARAVLDFALKIAEKKKERIHK